MDWTGGTRRRYAAKGANNAVLRRQKAHFAKARATAHPTFNPSRSGHLQDALSSKQYRPLMESSQRTQHSNKELSLSSRSRTRSSGIITDRVSYNATPLLRTRAECPRSLAGHLLSANLTDEEKVLLANRERLLAREDWLGLKASRPVRYRFPSYRDRDRIGKRRKVNISKLPKFQTAEERPMVTAFDRLHTPVEPLMSGALPDDDIQIKIGTDALISQTQRSRSRTPVNTSMRQPSTELGPLSEESMLLKVDEDGFELATDNLISCANADGRFSEHVMDEWITSTGQAFTGLKSFEATAFATSRGQSDPIQSPAWPISHQNFVEQSRHEYELQRSPCPLISLPSAHTDEGSVENNEVTDRGWAGEHHHSLSTDSDRDEKDDEKWQRLMKIKRHASRNASRLALRSSSIHATQSTASLWPLCAQPVQQNVQDEYVDGISGVEAEAPRDLQTIPYPGSIMQNISPCLVNNSKPSGLIPVPLIPPDNGAAPKATVNPASDPSDNELWRQYVVASQNSDGDSSEHIRKISRQAWEDSDHVLPATDTAPEDDVNEIYSDIATLGRSILPEDVGPKITGDSDIVPGDFEPTTSMVGHATTVDFGDDDIEDSDDQHTNRDVSHSTGNIHAAQPATILKPRRFAKSKQRTLSPVRGAAGFRSLSKRGKSRPVCQ